MRVQARERITGPVISPFLASKTVDENRGQTGRFLISEPTMPTEI